MTVNTIVVPLDGSQFGESALPYALSLARRSGARIELIHVYVPSSQFSSADINLMLAADDPEQARLQAQQYLDKVAQRVRESSPAVSVNTTLLEGVVADAIYEYTEKSDATLLVLSTHGRGAISRFWLGSVATELIHTSSRPLLLIRPTEGPIDLTKDHLPTKILIPLEETAFAEQIIPLAVEIGSICNAQYRLLQVVPPLCIGGMDHQPESMIDRPVSEQFRAKAVGYLNRIKSQSPGLENAEIEVPLDWPPATAILNDVDENRVDLIALATRGRSGLSRMIMGSVADKIFRGATVPILLQRFSE